MNEEERKYTLTETEYERYMVLLAHKRKHEFVSHLTDAIALLFIGAGVASIINVTIDAKIKKAKKNDIA